MTAVLVKYCTNSFTVIWRGVLVNCLVPCYFFLFLSRSSVHGHAFPNSIAIFAHSIHTALLTFWNHLICESSHLSSRGTLSCFAFLFQCSQSVLRNLSSFFREQRFCLPLLCFNSEKQAPTHLSVFPYLLPHCVLEDLSTTQVTWVGGEEVCRGGVGGLVSHDFNTNEHPTIPESSHSNNKSFTSRDYAYFPLSYF